LHSLVSSCYSFLQRFNYLTFFYDARRLDRISSSSSLASFVQQQSFACACLLACLLNLMFIIAGGNVMKIFHATNEDEIIISRCFYFADFYALQVGNIKKQVIKLLSIKKICKRKTIVEIFQRQGRELMLRSRNMLDLI